jgi:hypothetical protein
MNTYNFSKSVSDALNLPHIDINLELVEGVDYIPYDSAINSGVNNGFYGMTHSEETLQKMRKPKKSTVNMSYPKSQEHRNNISKSRKGKSWTNHSRLSMMSKCKYCGMETIKTNITRYHNEKCKTLTKEIL